MVDYAQFKKYCEAIVKDGDFHNNLAPAVMGLAEMLFEITEISDQYEPYRQHIHTDNGSAIGVFWAAQCVKELLRTQRFARGLIRAIRDIKEKKNGQPVHVLYAGTGPFATLALPAMALLAPQDVQFTLLEINPESYSLLTIILNALDLNSFVKTAVIADATSYSLIDREVDIVLSETMNRALIKEPQVSIMLNLASQVPEKAIFIPEEIKVTLCQKEGNASVGRPLTNLIVFNKSFMFNMIEKCGDNNWLFEETTIIVDLLSSSNLQYETEIKVYKDDFLKGFDCSLNLPERLKFKNTGGRKQLKIQYNNVGIPGFKFEILDL